MQTNKNQYIDQMVNRDVLEKVHERMNDEMVAAAAAATDPDSILHTEDFHTRGHWCRIALDQSNKVYLPDFLNNPENIADPAFKVSTGMQHMVVI